MNKQIILTLLVLFFATTSCKKKDPIPVVTVTSSQLLSDFANKLANPNYQDVQDKASSLLTTVQLLNTTTTDINLNGARTAWRDLRAAWEMAEGFLFGPVEDFNYDPMMDTWPVNKVDLDFFNRKIK